MNDEAYIRKAVKLAGWQITEPFIRDATIYVAVPLPDGECYFVYLTELKGLWLDALAAQLERQVITKGIPFEISHEVDKYGTSLVHGNYDVYLGGGVDFLRECNADDDRSMSRIKAIVDSGVLEKNKTAAVG